MDAWNSDYDRRRADAETNEEILHQRHATLEIAEDVQLTNSQETQAPAEAQDYLAVTRAWCPADLQMLVVRNRSFTPDVETRPASLAEAMDTLRQRIDSTFQWENKILDQTWLVKRAAAQAAGRTVACARFFSIECTGFWPHLCTELASSLHMKSCPCDIGVAGAFLCG